MRFWNVVLLVAVSAFSMPMPALRAQQPLLTKDLVLNLVRNQLGDEAGAKAIHQRGIDFVPAEDFLSVLRDAGAKDAFIQELRATGTPKPESAPARKPIGQIQIINLLAARVSSQRVAALNGERGIDFGPTEEFQLFLQAFSSEGVLGRALCNTRVIKPQLDPGALAEQTQVQDHVSRGLNLLRQGKSSESVKEFQSAVDLDSTNSELRFLLTISLREDNKYDEALVQLREGIRLNSQDGFYHANLAAALEEKNDWDGAIAEYREFVRLAPTLRFAHQTLGSALLKMGNIDGAIAELREAV